MVALKVRTANNIKVYSVSFSHIWFDNCFHRRCSCSGRAVYSGPGSIRVYTVRTVYKNVFIQVIRATHLNKAKQSNAKRSKEKHMLQVDHCGLVYFQRLSFIPQLS